METGKLQIVGQKHLWSPTHALRALGCYMIAALLCCSCWVARLFTGKGNTYLDSERMTAVAIVLIIVAEIHLASVFSMQPQVTISIHTE